MTTYGNLGTCLPRRHHILLHALDYLSSKWAQVPSLLCCANVWMIDRLYVSQRKWARLSCWSSWAWGPSIIKHQIFSKWLCEFVLCGSDRSISQLFSLERQTQSLPQHTWPQLGGQSLEAHATDSSLRWTNILRYFMQSCHCTASLPEFCTYGIASFLKAMVKCCWL